MFIPLNLGARALGALALVCVFLLSGRELSSQAPAPADDWAVVLAEKTPILRKVENVPDAITHLLWPGVLVTRLKAATQPATLTLDVKQIHYGAIKGSGVLDPVQVKVAEKALAFRNSLGTPAVKVPGRSELCARFGAAAGTAAADCAGGSLFILAPPASSKRPRVAAVVTVRDTNERLIVMDLEANAPAQSLPVTAFEYRGWLPLGDDYSVILGEQYRRQGNRTGFALTPIVVTPQGRLVPGAEVDFKTAEPTGGTSRVVESTYRVVNTKPFRIAIEGTEEILDIKSGKSQSKRKRIVDLSWDLPGQRFRVSERTHESPKP